MNRILSILGLLALISCGPDSNLDCFQQSGTIVQTEFNVRPFRKIIAFERVQLIVSYGETQKVMVETGANLLNEIQVKVEDSILKISDGNSCNFVRDIPSTRVFVTSPNINEIRNGSSFAVKSSGTLTYPRLVLISIDESVEGLFHNDGGFDMDLDIGSLRVDVNGVSKTVLRGKSVYTSFIISDSDSRIEAENLIVENLYIFHRGTNNMIVNPIQSIRGEIRSLGDVISINTPPRVEVEELYTGRLIFE